jgi:hypothetical protein
LHYCLVQKTSYTLLQCFVFQQGDKVMVAPWVKPDDYGKLFQKGVDEAKVPSGKNYLRLTEQPK